MRRVVITGPPGGGKSTLARRLGARHGLPVFHLDQAFWQPGWVRTPQAAFEAEVARLAALPEWVIDGNDVSTLATRLRAADTLVYLDVSAPRALFRIVRRLLAGHGRVRTDSAPGCPERLDRAFLRFAWSWNRLNRARHLALAAGFPGRAVVLRRRADVRRLLAERPASGA